MTDFLAAMAGSEAMRTLPMPVADLVGEWFESDALRAAIAWRGLVYTGLGPRMPGTAGLLLADAALSGGGLAGQVLRARGGPGALIDALAAALQAGGGEIRRRASVDPRQARRPPRPWRDAGGWRRDRRAGGRLGARSADDPARPARAGGDRAAPRVARGQHPPERVPRRASSSSSAAHPSSRPQAGTRTACGGRIVIAPSMRYLELAMRPARYAAGADEPLIVATPRRRPPDARSRRPRRAPEIGDAVTRAFERHAPGFGALIVERRVIDAGRLWRASTASGVAIHSTPRPPSTSPLRGARCMSSAAIGCRSTAITSPVRALIRAVA